MKLVAACAAVAAALTLSCGSARQQRPKDLDVTSYTPEAPIEAAESIEIQFDKPAIDETEVGRPIDPAWLAIRPAVAWTGHWRDRQTMVIDPAAELAPATRYTVALAGPLRDRTAGFAFDFVHQPLEVDGLWGIDTESLPPGGPLPVAFNQPVRARDAAARCSLAPVADSGDTSTQAIALTAREPDKIDATAQLVPGRRLAAGASYTLTCAGVKPATGNLALEAPYELTVRARPPLSVTAITPNNAVDLPADEVMIEIELATEVSLDAIRKAVTATPAIPGLEHGWLDGTARRYTVVVDLAEKTTYKLAVADLADVYGQALAAPETAAFTTGVARARLSLETGIFALEASAKGYPVWSRNLTAYQLECAAIPRTKLVHLVTTEMNYDPWGGNNDSMPIDWKALGATAETTQLTVATAKNTWHHDDLDFGARCGGGKAPGARGVYLADVTSPQITVDPNRPWLTPNRHRVLANVTDLGVLIKVGPASGIVWVTSLASGDPVPGAKVTVYTPTGTQVATGSSDKDGLVRIPGSAIAKAQASVDDADDAGEDMGDGEGEYEDWDSYRSQRLIAVVEKADDLAIVDGNWANGIQIWNFGVPEERRGGKTRIRGFIQSDRGIYRPGEQVHFKGLVRELAQNTPPRVPRDRAVAVEVTDSRGTAIYTGKTTLSGFGGFFFDLALSSEAILGDYYVKASLGGQVFRERFMVEEYRPAAFELDVKSAGAPRPGARLTFTATARYLFGAPVTDATVEWNLRRRPHAVHFAGFDEYSFTERDGAWWYRYDEADEEYGDWVADGTGTTDGNGVIQIAARDPDRPSGAAPQDYIVSVNVTDDSDQTIGKSVVVTAHQQQLYLGVHAQEYVQAVDMPFGVNVVAVDPDGKRIAATAKLSFIRDETRCTWTEVGNRAYQKCDTQQAVALERTIQIPATGTATERIFPKDPGSYLVRVETTDARGTKVVTGEPIWVLGKGEAFWSGDESARMTLIASRKSYLPGDTAKLVAQANLDKPTALITIERDGVLEAFTRKLASASEGVELTIKDAWAPNVYAGVTLVQGRRGEGDRYRPQMKMGVVELAVATTAKQLDVAIELDRAQVKPGEPVHGRIRVTAGGVPVKAEVAVSVADEGVLQLIAYQTPNPLATFYKAFGLGVDSGTNWNRVAKLADPDATDPDGGGDSPGAGAGKVRSRFVSSAFWAPALVTDARGEATFELTAPDNLTAFRVMAVAADAGDRFGAGEKRLTIAKPVMARPALPRFLGSGDTTAVGVVIHNDTDKPGTARVTAKATGVTLDRGETTLDVPAHGVARAMFSAKAGEAAAVTFEFAVALNGDGDAVRVTLPVVRPRVIETRTIAKGALDGGGTKTFDISVPADVLRDESEVVVTIDRTGLGDLEPSLRYLVEYPYGCLEQTMSKFVPLAKAKDLAGSLGISGLDGTKMNAYLRAGVDKVIRHQQRDGNFSLWPQSTTYPHLTALAMWGLTEARKAGVTVPDQTFSLGLDALRSWTTDGVVKPDGDGATMAMAAYLMAAHGSSEPAVIERLYAERAGLPTWGQAFLLRAMKAAKSDAKQIEALRGQIVGSLIEQGDALVAPEDVGGDEWMSSDVRSTAMVLAALIEVAPRDRAIEKLVRGLDTFRRADGRWGSTQENMWSLVALADYARSAAGGESAAALSSGGTALGTARVAGGGVSVTRLPLSRATDTLTIAATGTTHYAIRVVSAKRDDGRALSRGFSVQREYLDDAGQPLTRGIKAGDLVTVRLTVKVDEPTRWVAIVDPLPAGFEVVNPRLATSADTSRAPATTGDYYWDVEWAYQEIRDDHVEWFADYIRDGSFELFYKARAATAGEFAVAPARAEAMYEPDVMGRNASTKVTIAP